jgi:DUF4097 and DUF4098 domain-containing protein YvlB
MSEVERRPAGTMSTERRYGIAISVALILGGAWWALTDLTEDTHKTENHYPVTGNVLTIESGSADLEIRSGDVQDVTVTRRTERNVLGSEPKEKYKDGKLEIDHGGCGILSFGCDTEYVVVVPRTLKVTAEAESGELKVSDLSAGADLKSSSGGIEVHKLGGEVQLHSSSGDLEARDLDSSKVVASASSGNVELSFSSPPTSVDAKASSGDVTIQVPDDDAPYAVTDDSSSGERSVEVDRDDKATRSIRAKTSSGDVSVEYAGN